MKPRNTLVALLLLAALGVYVYVVEVKGKAAKTAEEEKAKKVWDVGDGAIDAITLTRPTGTIALSRKAEAWQVTAPITTDGDDFTPADMARTLASLKRDTVVDEAPSPEALARYGLDAPRLTVSFTAGAGAKGEIAIGRKNPIGSTHYARVPGRPEVFLVDGYGVTAIDKDLFALRNKKLLSFKEDEVTAMEIRSAGRTSTLVREGERWWLASPLRDLAREEAIRGLLGSLRFMEATRFVEDPSAGLDAYGLAEPAAHLTLTVGEGAATQSLLLGGKVPGEEGVFVKRGETAAVAVAPVSLLTDLAKGPEDLREARALPFDRWDASEIEVRSGTTGILLARAEVDVDGVKQRTGDWQVAELAEGKAGEPSKADWRAVEDYLKALGDVTATSFLDAAPAGVSFDAPALALKITVKKSPAPLEFRIATAADGSAYVKDAARAFVLQVPPETRGKLLPAAGDLREKPAEPGADTPPPPPQEQG